MPVQALSLPAGFIIPEKRPKRSPRPVDFDIFTEEQRVFVEEAVEYVDGKRPEYRMLALMGYAGTGKTFTIGALQDIFLYTRKLKVAVTAPTNKAVQVIRDMCEIAHTNLTITTIYKLLGLKDDYDDNGRLKFVPDPQSPPSLQGYDVLICDETSMFNDDLFNLVNPFIEKEGLKIIFVGDPAQIPPVARMDCIPFNKKRGREFQIKLCQLTRIMRQSGDNPLLDYATAIRQQRDQEEFDYDYKPVEKDNMGIYPISKDAQDLIYKICETYFCNPIFAQYPDFMKVVAWRNKVVDAVNARIRQLIYKQEYKLGSEHDQKYKLPRLMIGEKMLANEPVVTQEQSVITTNQEFMVIDFNIATTKYTCKFKEHVIFREDFKYYHAKVATMTDRGPRVNHIWIIHEDSLNNYDTCMNLILMYAHRHSGFERKAIFRECYFKLKRFFADVKYNYAITAHKAQGSTYENCMMIEWDMYENFKFAERNRIRYVAATRARNKLFVIKK